MKKFINYLILFIFCTTFFLGIHTYKKINTFNTDNVLNTINFLCSNDFKGRLAGTLENIEVEEYIKLKFIQNNLKPFMGDYSQCFKVKYPKKINGVPNLNITDSNGNVIKNFHYGKDYKEDMVNFKNNSFSFNKNNPLIISQNKSIQINQNNDCFLFYIPSKENLNFRSSFEKSSPFSMCIMTTTTTLNEIKTYLKNGYNINCFIPFISKDTTVRNIFGCIEGKNTSLNPIIISAHFDHIGCDLNNTVYRGALDNASGTAFMLEFIKYIRSFGKPNRNILFIGFNAEEFGCLGSCAFVSKYKNHIKNSKVFNFDMIGSDNGIPLCIVGGKKDTLKNNFLKSISDTCSNKKIHFNYIFDNVSDHTWFRDYNINAVTLCDNDLSRIHTPNDDPKFIRKSAITRCFNIASKEILKSAYKNHIFIYYNKQIIIISFFGICTSLLFLDKMNKIKK